MKRFCAINLIAFCALVLFRDDNSMTEGHGLGALLGSLKQLKNLRHGILPGTLWCGLGDIARDDSELGIYQQLDACCRTHDGCEDYIEFRAERYGLYNRYICRSSLCECEWQFYDCLKRARGLYAATVGKLYFAKCKQCFRTYYNAEACVRKGLVVMNEGEDRKGRRVFCAKFDRNPKWGHRHNVTLPKSISTLELSTWDDDNEPTRAASPSYSANDSEYFDDGKDYAIYGD